MGAFLENWGFEIPKIFWQSVNLLILIGIIALVVWVVCRLTRK